MNFIKLDKHTAKNTAMLAKKRIFQYVINFAFTLLALGLFAQEKSNSDLASDNPEYFNTYAQEKFFLHTNKTMYFSGEKIWWQAYVVSDFSNKPMLETVNLHIALYDSNKTLLQKTMFYSNDGIAYGDLKLSDSLNSGTYYLSVDTQWSKNFKSKYIRELQIINIKPEGVQENTSSDNELTSEIGDLNIDFYPESGTILNGIKNTINFKLNSEALSLHEALPVFIIDNTSGQAIARSSTNHLGLGSVSFVYQPKHSYTAQINYKNKAVKFDLPSANTSGIIIQEHDDLKGSDVEAGFTIHFSKDLISKYHNDTFFAIIHRNQKARYVLPVVINKKYTKYKLPFSEDHFFNGVNTLSIFNKNNQPVAERHFFSKTKQNLEITILPQAVVGDSMELAVKMPKSMGPARLSIAIVPEGSKLNKNNKNISESLLLEPYLDVLPTYNTDTLSKQTLDLITQIYATKTTRNPFKSAEPLFQPETGIKIAGSVNANLIANESYKVMLTSTTSSVLQVVDLKQDNKFVFDNLVMQKDSKYNLALIDKTGSIQKARFFVYNTQINYKDEIVLNYNSNTPRILKSNDENFYHPQKPLFLKDAEQLEEVKLYGKENKQPKFVDLHSNKPHTLGAGFTKQYIIEEQDKRLSTLVDFLNRQAGISASVINASVIVNSTRGSSSFLGGYGTQVDSTGNTPTPKMLLIFDGQPMIDHDVLYGLRMSQVEDVSFNSLGAGYGFRGTDGVLHVNTKKGGGSDSIVPPLYQESTLDIGFTAANQMYSNFPMQFISTQSKIYYEALDWKPNVLLAPNRETILKIYKGQHKNILLTVNGMNQEGALIYKQEIIDLTEKL
ncbi:hypothetical protein ACFFVB_15310 [Formosa undariae]|uniref:TonB-dependent receptor plug domain-containing protein n=1 Tax=Formosa undariae TaxID=1325436 RepID=A0ABV5F4T6_9FLAO